LQSVLAAYQGMRQRGNQDMSWWHFGDSDLKNVRHENGIH